MREGTDEAKKVIRNEGSMWYAAFRKRDLEHSEEDRTAVDKQIAKFFI